MKLPEMSFPPSPPSGALGPMYLSRLARLVKLRRELDDDLNSLGVDLIERAIGATVKDCIGSGAGGAAAAIVADGAAAQRSVED